MTPELDAMSRSQHAVWFQRVRQLFLFPLPPSLPLPGTEYDGLPLERGATSPAARTSGELRAVPCTQARLLSQQAEVDRSRNVRRVDGTRAASYAGGLKGRQSVYL